MSQYIELAKIIDEHGISKVVGFLKEVNWNKGNVDCDECMGTGAIVASEKGPYIGFVCNKCKGAGKI